MDDERLASPCGGRDGSPCGGFRPPRSGGGRAARPLAEAPERGATPNGAAAPIPRPIVGGATWTGGTDAAARRRPAAARPAAFATRGMGRDRHSSRRYPCHRTNDRTGAPARRIEGRDEGGTARRDFARRTDVPNAPSPARTPDRPPGRRPAGPHGPATPRSTDDQRRPDRLLPVRDVARPDRRRGGDGRLLSTPPAPPGLAPAGPDRRDFPGTHAEPTGGR
jgi:hypothetical protein